MAYRKSLDFLPSIFQTKTNEKILQATMDQLISEPEVRRVDGYIGRRFNPALTPNDSYIAEDYIDRQNYQLEPSTVYTDNEGNIKFVSSYVDLLNKVESLGGNITNPSRLFSADQYSYSGFFDFDKFVNYSSYYWLPNGPDSVNVFASEIPTDLDIEVTPPTAYRVVDGKFDIDSFDTAFFDVSENDVNRLSNTGYTFDITGGAFNPVIRLARGGTYRFNVNQSGHGFFIQTQPGLSENYNWQNNLGIRDILGVENNGEDVGTITFNVPTKDAQDFFLNMPVDGTANLVAYSSAKRRKLKYTEVQNANYREFIREHSGIDNQRSLVGKTILFLDNDYNNVVPQPWAAKTDYKENDLIRYSNTVYRVLTAFTSGRVFSDNNLELYDFEDHWYDPALFDATNIGFDSVAYDKGVEVPLENRLGLFTINVNSEGLILLTPIKSIGVNKKIKIGEGTQYGNREIYRNSNNKLELIPAITANQDYLYYQDAVDPFFNGVIEIVDQDNNLNINVNTLLGRSTYTSPNGVVFENGLKVRFSGNTVPEIYKNREYYVEGVGESIELISVDDLITPEPWLDTISTPFDSVFFDAESFDKSQPAPADKQYIVNKRNSREGSSWTRQNRWFHENVIKNTDNYNNFKTEINQNNRAKRPIIEFEPNIQMYNFGSQYKTSVTVIDTTQTDVLSNVEGVQVETIEGVVSGYYSDGIPLVNGNRVIFTNDESQDIKKTVWEVQWITPESPSNNKEANFVGDGTTTSFDLNFNVTNSIRLSVTVNNTPAEEAGYQWSLSGQNIVFLNAPAAGSAIKATYVYGQQIHLVAIDTITEGDVVLSELGNTNQGTNWYFKNNTWTKAQIKISNNQAPMFDLFDNNGNSISDSSVYVGSNFTGNKLFAYKIGNTTVDNELGLRLSYKTIDNIGDIVFVDHITNDSFSYEDDNENTVTLSTKNLNTKKNFASGSVFANQWVKLKDKTQQYQTQTFFATIYQKNRFRLNVYPQTLDPKNIIVYKNNVPLMPGQFDVTIEQGTGFLDLAQDLSIGDKLDVKVFSNTFTNRSVWEIPSNLENNAKNQDFKEITLGQLRNHIVESFVKTPGITGSYQGSNNIKDLPNVKTNGGKIVQNAGAPHLANLFLNDVKANFHESLLYSQREYAIFKNKFARLAEELPLTDFTNSVLSVDEILENLFANKNELFPFYHSDMVPAGKDYKALTYKITNSDIDTYYLSQPFDDTTPSNKAVLVYLNGNQLTYGLDYNFIKNQPILQLNIAPSRPDENLYYLEVQDNDVLEIREYDNTDGFHVPPTPTKLGLYPAYRPKIVQDGYGENVKNVIRGHDGSLTVAYGDYRDDIILELEKRFYNNIKTRYNENLLDIKKNIPGAFRSTDYTKQEFETILSSTFGSWLGKTNLQLTDYSNFDANDAFTWNYAEFTNRLDNSLMPAAYWRGLYRYYYDTEQPNLRPWEMLGFTEEPSWWKNEYGPAPYTSGNSVLWDDLENGIIKDGDRAGTYVEYQRPGLSNIIPVNDSGELLAPFESLTLNSAIDVSGPWRFGDGSPVETAWIHSSEYPYAIQLALALTKPAEYFGLLRDTGDQTVNSYDRANNTQWSFSSTGLRNKIEYVNGELVNNEIYRSSGYTSWIAEYAKSMNLDITEEVGKKLRNSELRLAYKVGGYTDKKYIKLYADQSSPNSQGGSVLIPDSDFQIKLVKSSPRLSLTYSGVIISKTGNGYAVNGYDQNKPYFVIETGRNSGETKFIISGTDRVEVAKYGSGRTVIVPYNTELLDKAEVVDFLIGLGRYYENQGFRFNRKVDSPDGADYHNWELAAKEFLFWTQQGWDNDIVISISPIGDQLEYRSARGAIDAISNKPYGSRILDNSFGIINKNQYTVNREGRNFSLTTNDNKGIYLADLDVVDYEHVIVLDNTTRFNDVIYQPELGNRQFRIKMTGFKTSDWDGAFGAAGFIINDNNIKAWSQNKNYYKGEIVTYKGNYYVASTNIPGKNNFDNELWLETEYNQIDSTLLPNLANRAGQPKSFYDFNQSNLELDADRLGKGLIGFTPREYLDNLGISDTSQVKFYQGMIHQKGSNSSLDKLLRAKLDNFDGSAEIFEQWAIRNGSYGITGNTKQVRIPLSLSNNSIKNPVVVELLNANDESTNGRISIKEKDLLTYSRPYDKNIISYRNSKSEVNDLPSAGFTKADEVNYAVTTFANTTGNLDSNVTDGSRLWVGRNEIGTWNVYRFTDINLSVDTISIDGTGVATIKTETPHGFSQNDKIFVKTYPTANFSNFYFVSSVINDKAFTVSTGFNLQRETAINAIIYTLLPLKQEDITGIPAVTPPNGWKNGDQFYIENATDAGWGVYERTQRFTTLNRYSANRETEDRFGVSVAAARNNDYILVGSSASSTVQAYKKTNAGVLNADSTLFNVSSGLVDFGATLTASNFGYAAVGSPNSGDIGYVHILSKNLNGSFIVEQAIAPNTLDSGGQFGQGIAISEDGRWLYVGQPGVNEGYVWVYQLNSVSSDASQTFLADGSTTTFTLTGDLVDPESIYALKIVGSDGFLQIPYRDFTLSGNIITFTSAPAFGELTVFKRSYYDFVTKISLADSSNDQFGFNISTSTDGSQLIIGSPTANQNGTGDVGKVYVVERTIQKFYADESTKVFVTNDNVQGDIVVKVDDVVKTRNTDFVFDGNKTVTFTQTPESGSIITIETNNFVLTQTLYDFESIQAGAQFGYSLDLCPNNCSLYIGAPFEDDTTIDGGKVHRFINQGRFFGKVNGTISNPTLSGASKILINNFLVSFTGSETLDDIVNIINAENIPGVTATGLTGKLVIDSDSTIFADKLNLALVTGTFFEDTGIEVYASQQVIESPRNKNYNNFGKVVRVSPDALNLAVGTDQGDMVLKTTFDNETTTFDLKNTEIIAKKTQSGSVFVYQFIARPNSTVENPSQLIFAEELIANDIVDFSEFGSSIEYTNNTIYVGAPNSSYDDVSAGGIVYGFTNNSKLQTWDLIRSESPKVDLNLINRVYLYNSNTSETIVDFDIIDPAKGFVSGAAKQEISYQTEVDPALYNNANNTTKGIIWGRDHVGEIWWNIALTQWIEYEQDDIEYRAGNWGFGFPSSRVICAEWTESELPPENYADPENPSAYALTNNFNVFSEYNQKTGRFDTKYYFWVVGKTKAPRGIPNRKLSTSQIEEVIANPKLNNVPYVAFYDSNCFGIYNVSEYIQDGAVIVIDYDVDINDGVTHTEYKIIGEGDRTSLPDSKLVTKLIDSLAGQDRVGNIVPDPALNEYERIGIGYRPRQTMFVNRRQALRDSVAYVNNFLKSIQAVYIKDISSIVEAEPFPDVTTYQEAVNNRVELGYLVEEILPTGYLVLVKSDETTKNRWVIYEKLADNTWFKKQIQSYNNGRYVDYVTWTDPEVNVPAIVETVVEFEYNLQSLTAAEGDFVKIKDNGLGLFKIVLRENNAWRTVQEERSTIQINESIWKTENNLQGWDNDGFGLQLFDDWPSVEIQNIFRAVYDNIFVDEDVVQKNLWFIHMVKYALTEKKYSDWAFKTSLIKVNQTQRALQQIPVFQQDNQDFIRQYIEEVKPYHTKISEFVLEYSGDDIASLNTTDFDLPAYYNFETGQYRSPTGATVEDDIVLQLDPYINWSNNYTLSLSSVDIYHSGSGYIDPPRLSVEGGGGSGAKVEAVVSSGKIVRVIVTDPGSGYITTPTIVVNQFSADPAIMHARMINQKVRSFDTTIKFDRVSTPAGWLVEFKDSSGASVDIRNENISRVTGAQGVIDEVLELLSNGGWIVDSAELDVYPVAGVPNYKYFDDTSGRVRFFERRDTKGWTTEKLQQAIRDLGTSVGINNIDISGTTVTLDGSYASFMSSVLPWTEGLTYYQNEYVGYNSKLYRVDQQFVAGSSFTSEDLTELTGAELESHLDRTWALYQPTDGMLGKDLSQLFDGVVFPGVNIVGANFNQNPGYDVGNFDVSGFDSSTIGPEGVPVIDPNILDQTLYSSYLDTTLGTKPEDIITQGGSYIDTYHSHAPEEMVPGRVYDTLEMRVHTLATSTTSSSGFGLDWNLYSFVTDGVTKRFKIDGEHIGDHFMVYLKNSGPRYRNITSSGQALPTSIPAGSFFEGNQSRTYNVDYINNEIVFDTAPLANDILQIYNVRLQGESIITDEHFTADGSTALFELVAATSTIANALVLIDGVETTDYIFYKDPSDSSKTLILFDTAPAKNTHVHIMLSGNFNKNTISKPYTQIEMVSDSNRQITLDENIRYDRSKDTVMLVELNGNRLTPGNTNYYTGDSSTTVYSLPSSASEVYNTLTIAEVQVWKDGTRLNSTDYVLSAADGSSIPTVTFFTAPGDGSKISITYTGNADYFYDSATNSVRISSNVTVDDGSLLAVTSFSSHDAFDIKTKVFVGSEQLVSTAEVEPGYDTNGFDSSAFDSTVTISTINFAYQIDDDQSNAQDVIVTINGVKQFPNIDYTVNNGAVFLAEGIIVTDSTVVIVTWSNSNQYRSASTFQIFKSMDDTITYKRLADDEATVLAKDLKITDTEIHVVDGSKLSTPNPELIDPGVIFVNGERITYYTKSGNVLGQIRRGTHGTGAKNIHEAGSVVADASARTDIPNGDTSTWYDVGVSTPANGSGLQTANTIQANFLHAKKGLVISRTVFPEGETVYIENGYVEDGYVE